MFVISSFNFTNESNFLVVSNFMNGNFLLVIHFFIIRKKADILLKRGMMKPV